jgi:16S rRNA (cytidine1402-2'-O)-methyltransferase
LLYLVPTPIGHLDDITLRALQVLREVDVIFAEDTRHTRRLLDHHGIPLPPMGLVSCHDHNEAKRIVAVKNHVEAGRTVALVSDAGTPTISDPGYRLVSGVLECGVGVVPLPGACAAITALSASGLPSDRFTFAGFPPKKAGARRRWLDELATAPGTLILYCAAREVPKVLHDLRDSRGDVPVAVYREVTKTYEECLRGTATAVLQDWEANPRKGEVTVLAGRPIMRDFDDASLMGMLRERSVKEVSADTGVSRRRLYALHLQIKNAD